MDKLPLPLEKAEETNAWLIAFDVMCRSKIDFLVVRSNREHGLIGRDLIDSDQTQLTCTFNIDSDYLQPIEGFKATIKVKESAEMPKFLKARKVPFHLQAQLDAELQKLQKQGVLEPVSSSNIASPVVWVKKADNSYRLCADFKATLNEKIKPYAYPLPTTEEIFSKVGESTLFAKVDLKSAYHQIELEEEAKKLSVINTHRGLFRFNRLQMGMRNSSAIFQRCMEFVLRGLDGVIAYQDDIMVHAESKRQLKRRLGAILQRLEEYHVTVNKAKCISETDSLKFLGFLFTKDGIKPDPALTERISEAKAPTSAQELASLLGLFTFFGRFVNNFAQLCAPLHDAKQKERFEWTDECDSNFQTLKAKLVSAPVLQPFIPSLESVVTVDASSEAIGAVLQQDDHPVLYISRRLSPTEKRYSNIEREGLAVLWACKRLEHFLLGKHFILESDHKPLIYIFAPDNAMKNDISPRLMNFAIKLMRFDFTIRHIKGEMNVVADALSRVLIDMSEIDHDMNIGEVNFAEPCVEVDLLRKETLGDRFLCDLKERILEGRWNSLSAKEKPFKKIAWQLTIDKDELIRVGSKVVPPQALHERIFRNAHQSHCGTQATIRLIDREFWWPQMRKYVDKQVAACQPCRSARFRIGTTNTTHTWPKEQEPWSRVHIDWAQTKCAGNVLIMVDTYSGWLEAVICPDRSTSTVINRLREIFSRFGVPLLLVSDNAPEFAGGELRAWLRGIGCRLMHSPEYRPSANGSAERMVRVLKDALKCYNPAKCSVASFIQRVLFVHRNTAQRDGQTPAEILLGRNVRCPIVNEYVSMQPLLYRPNPDHRPVKVTYLYKQGANTSVVARPDHRTVLAQDAQLSTFPSNDSVSSDSDSDDGSADDNESRRVTRKNRVPTEFFGNPVFH